jgi:hypothetical protein
MSMEEGGSGEDLDDDGGDRSGSGDGWRGSGMDPMTVEAARRRGAREGGGGARHEPGGGRGGSQ